MTETAAQEFIDTFYFRNGPCCGGCDWWRSISHTVGECTKSAPVPGETRIAMLGISWSTLPLGAGHVITPIEHTCGDFKDEFDWSQLPLPYRKRVGAPVGPKRAEAKSDG